MPLYVAISANAVELRQCEEARMTKVFFSLAQTCMKFSQEDLSVRRHVNEISAWNTLKLRHRKGFALFTLSCSYRRRS